MKVIENRPNPLTDYLRKIGPGIAALVGVVSWLGTSGVLSATQVAAVNDYADQLTAATTPTGPISLAAGAVVGLIAGGSTLLGVLRSGKGATDETTPVRSPRDIDGTALVRSDGLPLGGIRVNGRHADAGEQAPAGY